MIMNEKHICKICSAKIGQLQKHLTIRHNGKKLNDYLLEFKCGEEFNRINELLRAERSKNTPWSIEFYIARGKSEAEALAALNEKRKTRKKQRTSAATSEHWIAKGYTEESAQIRANQYRKDIGSLPSLEKYIVRFGEASGNKKWQEYQDKIANRQEKFLSRVSPVRNESKLIRWFKNSRTEHGPVNKQFSYSDYDLYCDAVRTATKLSISVYGDEIDPGRTKLGIIYGKNGYSLDHKFSKYGGFVNKIHPLVIGSRDNLQLISTTENSKKGQYCSISLDEVKSYGTILTDESISIELRNKINEIFVEQS